MELAMIGGAIVKVHRHGQGAKGGLTTKILALSVALGNRFDIVGVARQQFPMNLNKP